MKKFILFLLIASMIMGMIGCSPAAPTETEGKTEAKTEAPTDGNSGETEAPETEAPKEPVHISFWAMGQMKEQAGTEAVIAAMNEYSKEKINVTFDYTIADTDVLKLELATTNNIDLMWMYPAADLEALAKQNALYDLTDILPGYETLYNSITDVQWQSCEYMGKSYFIPVMKEAFTGLSLVTPAAMAQQVKAKSGIDWETIEVKSVRDLDKLTPYLAAVSAICDDMETCKLPTFNQYMQTDPVYTVVDSGVGFDSSTGKFVDLYATKEYADYLDVVHGWYESGYILEGRVTGSTTISSETKPYLNGGYDQSGQYGIHVWVTTPDNTNNVTTRYKMDILPKEIGNRNVLSTSVMTSSWVISAKADPETVDACMRFVELLATDTTFADMYAWGIEGVNFKYNENGQVSKIADTGYSNNLWTCTSVFAATPLDTEDPDKHEIYRQDNDKAVSTPVTGFRFDSEKTDAEVSALSNVAKEYTNLLEYGFYDPAEYLQKFLDARKAAGIDKVIAEMQAQYDAWAANK